MSLPITTLTAAFLSILTVILAFVTVLARVKSGHSLGIGNHPPLQRAIRAHGNLIEYAPIFLILLGLFELQGAGQTALTALAAAFCAARIAHAIYFHIKQGLAIRIIAFWGSALPIAIIAIWAVIRL